MKKYTRLLISLVISLCYTVTTYSNIIWPALIVTSTIFSSLYLVAISIAIEALLLYWLIGEKISYIKALFISFVGNAISVVLGSVIMTVAMLLWHYPLDTILAGTFSRYNIVANYILMYLGSALIELWGIHLLFGYSAKKLWIPVFIGNLITYVLVALFQFPDELMILLDKR